MELAVATRTAPLDWQAALDADPRLLSTALTVLEDKANKERAASRRRR